MDNQKKRERSCNFSATETGLLINLVEKHKAILENKKCDAVSWKEKDRIWGVIENEFNENSDEIYRSKKILKTKYESLKRHVRKKAMGYCPEVKTGGWTNAASYFEMASKVQCIIDDSADGCESYNGSDVVQQSEHSSNASETVDQVTKAKLEVIALQKKLLERETEEKEKQWEFDANFRKMAEEEQQLKIQLLKTQITKQERYCI